MQSLEERPGDFRLRSNETASLALTGVADLPTEPSGQTSEPADDQPDAAGQDLEAGFEHDRAIDEAIARAVAAVDQRADKFVAFAFDFERKAHDFAGVVFDRTAPNACRIERRLPTSAEGQCHDNPKNNADGNSRNTLRGFCLSQCFPCLQLIFVK